MATTDASSGFTDDQVRHRVRADVAARTPVDDREHASVRRFLDEFDVLDAPFSEAAGPTHVTGSGVVVGDRGVLLLKHKRLGFWLQPGGHIEPGETPWDAALRETQEETGLHEARLAGPFDGDGVPELLHLDVHPGGKGHLHLDLRYLIDAGDRDPDPPDGESQELGWFSWVDALEVADDGLRGILSVLSDLHS